MTFVVRTKAKAQAKAQEKAKEKANAIVKIRTIGKQ